MTFYISASTLETHRSESGKAIYLTVSCGGFNTGKRIEWFPISQLDIGNPNECGWCKVVIPEWILKQKQMIGYGNALKCTFEEADVE